MNKEEKCRIASYAAGLIEPEDFIFLDAGTTTGYMMDYLEEKNATFVTNAVVHAQKLAEMGMKVLLVGGELKSSTEAIVGGQATEMIRRYHFTKGFFGTNGVTKKRDLPHRKPVKRLSKKSLWLIAATDMFLRIMTNSAKSVP